MPGGEQLERVVEAQPGPPLGEGEPGLGTEGPAQAGRAGVADKDSAGLDGLEADVLLMAYPFGCEGPLSASEPESCKLFRSLDVVKNEHFAVVPSEDTLAPPSPARTR